MTINRQSYLQLYKFYLTQVMARKYIQVQSPMKPRKVFIDDLKTIHKRRHRVTPPLPRFDD